MASRKQKVHRCRRMDATGRLTIPAPMRRYLGIKSGDELSVQVANDDRSLIVKKSSGSAANKQN